MSKGPLVIFSGRQFSILRGISELGILSLDLASPPKRLWGDKEKIPTAVEPSVDSNRVGNLPLPSGLLDALQSGDNWSALSRRSVYRLWAYFLACEDPQRRMDAREVSTLAHQMSLLRHILDTDHLRSVLIADEVGLGKTVEAGFLIKELLNMEPGLRVLYLAPARLVRNVMRELNRLGLDGFRQWTSGEADARMTDRQIVASIHRAVHGGNLDRFIAHSQLWDLIIVDECHHLSDWAEGGGKKTRKYQLAEKLIRKQQEDNPYGRVILMSGTPHQGHQSRFENLLDLLRRGGETTSEITGRVIYRTKEDVKDWHGRPLFPKRLVNDAIVIDLSPSYHEWLRGIFNYFKPGAEYDKQGRAGGWRCAQALQWAASSPQAGAGFLIRQAVRAGWGLEDAVLSEALGLIRPYRQGPEDEQLDALYERIRKEVCVQDDADTIEDIEEAGVEGGFRHNHGALLSLLGQAVEILRRSANVKWEVLRERVLVPAGAEKIVLFAQPIETVEALVGFMQNTMGVNPALIIGGQSEEEREGEIAKFRKEDGPQFLVSSRAGGEGINLQVARRLVHLDVPWNPMELEQRVGRVHRFGSTRTVIVDTLVTKDSREERAFAIARQKLRMIASDLGGGDRFEMIFSRVMCLIPPESLMGVIIDDPLAPFSKDDETAMARLVKDGFERWKDFHNKFSEQQKAIKALDPGLVEWGDVEGFLKEAGGIKAVGGITQYIFREQGGTDAPEERAIEGYRLDDDRVYISGEQDGTVVRGCQTDDIVQLGLNRAPVAEILRKSAFPELPCGGAYIRLTRDLFATHFPGAKIGGILVFVRQVLKPERGNCWVEAACSLVCFVVQEGKDAMKVGDNMKGDLLRGLFKAGIKLNADDNSGIKSTLRTAETRLCDELRQPTDEEIRDGVRYAITPLFAGVVSA